MIQLIYQFAPRRGDLALPRAEALLVRLQLRDGAANRVDRGGAGADPGGELAGLERVRGGDVTP